MYNRGGYDPRYGSGRGYPPSHSSYGHHGYPPSGYPQHHGSSMHNYPNRQSSYAYQQQYRGAPSGPHHQPPAPVSSSYGASPNHGGPAAPRDAAASSRGRGGPAARGGTGARGGHFANLSWTPGDGVKGGHLVKPGDAARTQRQGSGSAPPPPASASGQDLTQDALANPPTDDDDDDNPFRPPADLRAEDEGAHKKRKTSHPSTAGAAQNSSVPSSVAVKPEEAKAADTEAPKPKMSFSIKGSAAKKEAAREPSPVLRRKNPIADAPVTKPPPDPAVAKLAAPKSANYVGNTRVNTTPKKPSPPPVRKEKIKKKRLKPRPELGEEFKSSESVYFRKTGNESVVGSGTYGKVYKAVHVYTGGLVALKKIRMEGERDGFPVTAIREIKLLQSLKHVNIVALQEVMVERNDCFMVFEYLSHDLTGLLNHPTFSLTTAHKKHLARQLFEGLDYLHRRGVLHRDIKAANILVSKTGELKLADFGLARFYQKRAKQDYTNRVITIWYRSPELLLGETQYGPAVDIWSAACVLVEVFTRHAIFPGDGGEINQLDKIYNVLGTPSRTDWPGIVDLQWYELLRPGQRQPNSFAEKYKDRVSEQAFDLLAAMFQYDHAKRPSAAEVLEHPYFASEEPKEAKPVELEELVGEWHEFESKALRKEKERGEREARRAAREKEKAGENGGAAAAAAGGAVGEKRKVDEAGNAGGEKKVKVG
ncbi:hypothetical protein MBLNU230_g0521t1 [Neophaeotheca triangularis]